VYCVSLLFNCFQGLWFRVRVLGLGFCVRVRVSVTGSGSYLNENFVILQRLCCHLVSVAEKPPN